METENIGNEIEIDVVGLFWAIWHKILLIVLVGIITAGIAFGYSKYLIRPQYVSTTQVYILSKQDANQKTLTTQDIAFATYLTNDYQVLLKSEPVLQEVKDELGINLTTEKLASMINVELYEEDTRIINISVTSTDPKQAKQIADKVRDVANEKTKSVMNGIEAVNPIDEAKLPKAPSSPNIKKNTVLGFLFGFGISVIVVAILFILDDTIKTPDDIEKKLQISVLASIPLKNSDNNSGKGKRKKKRAYEDHPYEELNGKSKRGKE